MASKFEYNSLIKSMPDNNKQCMVTGKLLLTDLNLVPPKWTMLFRGKYLSRDVNIEKLLCSSKDPVIIYKGNVKPPNLPFVVRINCSKLTQFENNGTINLDVQALHSVGDLRKRIATELGKPDENITLIYNDIVLKDFKCLKDYKIVRDGCQISVNINGKESLELLNSHQSSPLITESYKVCLGGNQTEYKDKLAFFNVPKNKMIAIKGRSATGRRQRTIVNRNIIEAMNSDTVEIVKQRICAVFTADWKKHSIFMNGVKLKDLETLESQGLEEGDTILVDFERSAEEELGRVRKNELVRLINEELKRKRERDLNEQIEKKRIENEKMELENDDEDDDDENGVDGDEEEKPKIIKVIGFDCKGRPFIKRYCTGKTLKFPPPGGSCHYNRGFVSSFTAQDLDNAAVTLSGVTPKHTWNLYSFGMNLYGTCLNTKCISREKKFRDENGVSYIAGYGNIILTTGRNKFPCPACKRMFPVKEFVLCGGRALFRFKKSGVGQPVKTVVIESEYDLMKYKTFGNTKESKRVKTSSYDFIEITTVKPWCGLYTCVGCDGLIRFKQDENVLRCGHAYHNECTPVNVGMDGGDGDDSVSYVGCYACDAEQLQSVYDMLGLEGENSSSEAGLVRPF